MTRLPTLKSRTEGRSIAVVDDIYPFLATAADTNGTYAIWEAILPPGGGPPPHVHSRDEEGFYILEGEITIKAHRIVATAVVFANMPIGTPHSFKNESNKLARMVIMVAKRGHRHQDHDAGTGCSRCREKVAKCRRRMIWHVHCLSR
jgi:uncharacterized cupin superfamily protein